LEGMRMQGKDKNNDRKVVTNRVICIFVWERYISKG
jgi:hypothetical protein